MSVCKVCKQSSLIKGNKSGLCLNCYQNRSHMTVNSNNGMDYDVSNLNNGVITDSSELSESIMSSSLTDLTVSGIINLISMINKPIEEKLNEIRDNLTPRIECLES